MKIMEFVQQNILNEINLALHFLLSQAKGISNYLPLHCWTVLNLDS
jgi:hypothetical protein